MISLTFAEQNWTTAWHAYTGPVRIVLNEPGCPVAYGEATGEVLYEQGQRPGMAVLLTTGAEVWTHPQDVYPVEVTA